MPLWAIDDVRVDNENYNQKRSYVVSDVEYLSNRWVKKDGVVNPVAKWEGDLKEFKSFLAQFIRTFNTKKSTSV